MNTQPTPPKNKDVIDFFFTSTVKDHERMLLPRTSVLRIQHSQTCLVYRGYNLVHKDGKNFTVFNIPIRQIDSRKTRRLALKQILLLISNHTTLTPEVKQHYGIE